VFFNAASLAFQFDDRFIPDVKVRTHTLSAGLAYKF